MVKVYFMRQPGDILRVEEWDCPVKSEEMDNHIKESLKDLCDLHLAEDAIEDARAETVKGNLIVMVKFLEWW